MLTNHSLIKVLFSFLKMRGHHVLGSVSYQEVPFNCGQMGVIVQTSETLHCLAENCIQATSFKQRYGPTRALHDPHVQ